MTKKELAAMRARVSVEQGKDVPPDAQAAADEIAEETRKGDLDNPQTQKEIEFPATVPLTLSLPEGRKECTIATQFSYEQVNELGVFEDLQSFATLVLDELRQFEWQQGDNNTYLAAMTTGRVRAQVRRILAKITVYDQPYEYEDENGRKHRFVRPTPEHFAKGLRLSTGEPDLVSMRKLADLLFTMYSTEVENQKKSRGAPAPD